MVIGYKIFSSILLNRLRDGGAQNKIWFTQFGFKQNVGTSEALFITRRIVENSWASKGGKTILLALDWAKAFDSISPDALLGALTRFGIPAEMNEMIRHIYSNRRFHVREAGFESDCHEQFFGISQGCPLSPFLFSILMSVLLHDARQQMVADGFEFEDENQWYEILYADDTLLMHSSPSFLEKYMSCIEACGKTYGLALNFSKVEALPIRCDQCIRNSDGSNVISKSSLKYLGCVLHADGHITAELKQRIGNAKADFDQLCKIWDHTALPVKKKLAIYHQCILTKLLYGLESAWLHKKQQKSLDAFHLRCLRRIAGISHSWISRVTNRYVLEKCGSIWLSQLLFRKQLLFYEKIVRLPSPSPIRDLILQNGTFNPLENGARKRGRPRLEWHMELRKKIDQMLADPNDQKDSIMNEFKWKHKVWYFTEKLN